MTTAQAAARSRTPTGKGTSCLAAIRTTLPPALGNFRRTGPWGWLRGRRGGSAERGIDAGEIARLRGRRRRRQAARGGNDEGHGQETGQDDDDAVRQVR